MQLLNPCAVVIDSVQTVYLKGVPGSPGGMAQVFIDMSEYFSDAINFRKSDIICCF